MFLRFLLKKHLFTLHIRRHHYYHHHHYYCYYLYHYYGHHHHHHQKYFKNCLYPTTMDICRVKLVLLCPHNVFFISQAKLPCPNLFPSKWVVQLYHKRFQSNVKNLPSPTFNLRKKNDLSTLQQLLNNELYYFLNTYSNHWMVWYSMTEYYVVFPSN